MQLHKVRICDKTGRWSIAPDGSWYDDSDGRRDRDQRLVHILAPAPFEVPGAVPEVHSVVFDTVNGAGSHSWVTQALVPKQSGSDDLEELQQHTVCVKAMLREKKGGSVQVSLYRSASLRRCRPRMNRCQQSGSTLFCPTV